MGKRIRYRETSEKTRGKYRQRERKRRLQLKELVDNLQSKLPNNHSTDESEILLAAHAYILSLREQGRHQDTVNMVVSQENVQLLAEQKRLTKSIEMLVARTQAEEPSSLVAGMTATQYRPEIAHDLPMPLAFGGFDDLLVEGLVC